MKAQYWKLLLAVLGSAVWAICCANSSPANVNEKSSDTRDGGVDGGGAGASEILDTDLALFESVFKDETSDEANSFFDPLNIADIRLVLPPDVWEQLIIDARDEEYVSAEVTINGEPQGEVGLRFKGYYGSLYFCFEDDEMVCSKLSMKIKFSEYDANKRFKGLKRINLHSLKGDNSLMREYVAYKLFREMSIPTARYGYANVHVNDELVGVYGLVEQIDDRFTNSRFIEGNGNLYKEVQLYFSDNELDGALRSEGRGRDHSGFKAYAQSLTAATDDTLISAVATWMNMTYLMRYMAVDDTVYNWDGITGFYCGGERRDCFHHNFYLYEEETANRLWLIPWDLNATFYPDSWLPVPPWNDLSTDCFMEYELEDPEFTTRAACSHPLLRALSLHQAESDAYDKALEHLLNNVMVMDKIHAEIDAVQKGLEPVVHADPDRDVVSFISAVLRFKDEVQQAHDARLKKK